jgi:hypothetical protein
MNKMASERLLITGKRKNLSPIEQAIKNEYVNKGAIVTANISM